MTNTFIYIVKPGDTLWKLAQEFCTTVEEIKYLNGLVSDMIYIGQQLLIPECGCSPNPGNYIIHTVVAGDTLWNLAQRYNTTVDAIMRLNGLTSDMIYIGQKLKIPVSGGGGGGYIVHTVVAGDTLWKLAQRYGTTVGAIKRLNGLTSDMIYIGQKLKIPVS